MLGAVPGAPGMYPVAINQPLDRAYLRPLQVPLFDSEAIAFAAATSVTWFQRPQSQADSSGLITSKTEGDTSLTQAGLLDYPREHSVLGFTVAVDSTIGLESISMIYRRAYFQFILSGNRYYLTVPFIKIPAGMGLEGAVASTVAASTTNVGVVSQFKNGMGHHANFYKFNLGRAALKIKPGEAFSCKLTFPTTLSGVLPTTLNNNMGKTASGPAGYILVAFIHGISWQSI